MSLPSFAGIILRHGSHYLLLQREGNAKYWPFYWGFPGGKMETGESALEAAIREVREEIGVNVSPTSVISKINISAEYIDGQRKNTLFLVETWDGTPENLEPKIHKDCQWFTLDELPEPMIPHVREGLFALLDGETHFEYDGIGEM